MYKAIGFDMGGVLIFYSIPNQLEVIADKLGVPIDLVKQVYNEIRPKLDVDEVTNKQFWSTLVKKTGSKADPIASERYWSDNYIAGNPIIDGMLELVDSLKTAGYGVGLLSNIDPEHGEINAGRGIFEHFDIALLSYRIQARKPDRPAYAALWQGLGVDPAELIFIDDLDINVESANKLGIKGLKFIGHEQLIKDLKKLDIKF